MLILALPKSASSSLASTLGRLHGLPDLTVETRSRFLPLLAFPEQVREFGAMARLHLEAQEIAPEVLDAIRRPGVIHKYHFPPTARNQDLLHGVRKVILLRNPADVVRAYWRGERAGTHPLRDLRFASCFSEESWMARAERTGLLDEMERFCAGWESHGGDKLVMRFEDLVRDPTAAVNRIERYLGLPESREVLLDRERYSRGADVPPPPVPLFLLRRARLVVKEGSRLVLRKAGLFDRIRAARRRRRGSSI
jgi:hypothetical protein